MGNAKAKGKREKKKTKLTLKHSAAIIDARRSSGSHGTLGAYRNKNNADAGWAILPAWPHVWVITIPTTKTGTTDDRGDNVRLGSDLDGYSDRSINF